MKIGEADQKYGTILRLEAELCTGLPDQSEVVELNCFITWGVHWRGDVGPDERPGYRAHVRPDWRGRATGWSTGFAARFAEIREALQRWERNEGPWPLARAAETPERKEP